LASTFPVAYRASVNHGFKAAAESGLGDRHHQRDRSLVSLLSNPLVEDERPGSVDEVTAWLEGMVAELEHQPFRTRH